MTHEAVDNDDAIQATNTDYDMDTDIWISTKCQSAEHVEDLHTDTRTLMDRDAQ